MTRIEKIAKFYESLNRQPLADRDDDLKNFREHVGKVKAQFADMTDDEWNAAFHVYMRKRLIQAHYQGLDTTRQNDGRETATAIEERQDEPSPSKVLTEGGDVNDREPITEAIQSDRPET